MKRIPLTRGKEAIVDDADYAYLRRWSWHYGCGYARRDKPRPTRGTIFMHAVVGRRKTPPIQGQVDHRNRNKLDNRRWNLRSATNSQNKANEGIRCSNTSGYRGVCWHRASETWRAYIVVSGRQLSLGYYNDKRQAAIAYNEAARRHCGEFAYQNLV